MIFDKQHRDEYNNMKELNFSLFKRFLESPARYEAELGVPYSAPGFESLVHEAVLEPDKFQDSVLHVPDKRRVTKEQKEIAKERGATIIRTDEFEAITLIAQRLREYGPTKELLDADTEVTMTGEFCGLQTRGRLDLYRPGGFIADLKVIDTITEKNVRFLVAKNNWHLQAAWYQKLVQANTSDVLPFYHIYVNKKLVSNPRVKTMAGIIVVAPMEEPALELGWQKITNGLERFKSYQAGEPLGNDIVQPFMSGPPVWQYNAEEYEQEIPEACYE